MVVPGRVLSRRHVLRGMGAGIALPWLEAMLPAQVTTAVHPKRLACVEMVHGAAGSTPEGWRRNLWSPRETGRGFSLSDSLQPLAPFQDMLTIVSNTDARPAEAQAPSEGGADHFRSSAVFLTAAHARQTAGNEVRNGISLDQLYAQSQRTPIPSLRLCIENFGLSGSCGFDYNCIYLDTISWASPEQPLAMTVNPRVAFEQLFGAAQTGSVLDGVGDPARSLEARLGNGDRARLDAHLTAIRALERRIEAIERHNAFTSQRERIAGPLGVPDSWEEHVELMFDLQVLAFATDLTRSTALKMSRDTSNRVFPESGVRHPFHTLSHHSERSDLILEFARLNRYHTGVFARFLEKLRATPEGDGNLLEHSVVLYGSPMGDSNTHNHRRLPLLVAGRGAGTLKGDLHVLCPEGTPHANLLLTLAQRLGIAKEQFGNSTGTLEI